MSYSNMTENLGLPQYIGTDKPNWDIDTNEAYKKIDDFSKSVNEKDNGQDSQIGELQSVTGRHTDNLLQIAESLSAITERLLTNETKVEGLETDTEKLNTDVTEHEGRLDVLEPSVNGLTNRVNTVEKDVVNVRSYVDELSKALNTIIAFPLKQFLKSDVLNPNESKNFRIDVDELRNLNDPIGTILDVAIHELEDKLKNSTSIQFVQSRASLNWLIKNNSSNESGHIVIDNINLWVDSGDSAFVDVTIKNVSINPYDLTNKDFLCLNLITSDTLLLGKFKGV